MMIRLLMERTAVKFKLFILMRTKCELLHELKQMKITCI
jgi:hypothetical protein